MEEMLKKLITEVLKEVLSANVQTNPVREIMTREQLAEYLQVSVAWVDKNIRSIPHLKGIGGTRFRRKDIDEWLETKLVEENSKDIKISTARSKSTYKVV